ncbi:MAG: lipopolysaccharide biosynthesis protein [Fusobacteriales bacterium]|nr:MAG: lipopolysaccharide biosynthesis protein [Fusobacteriales bacterium]
MNLINKKYKNFNLYYYNEIFFEIGKKIIDKKIKIIKDIKNTKRNYVALVEYDNLKYILKEPRNEFRIPQRKFFTIFKKGEVLSTLVNITKILDEEKIDNYARPFLAIVKRNNLMINYSSLLLEYSRGKEADNERQKYIPRIIEKMKEIHSLGYYHGDFKPGNFLIEENNKIIILDTQGKKIGFSNYRAHYDMLTMKMNSYPEMKYPYKKNCFYYLALIIKKIKKLKFIKKFREKKAELRDKGWKI